MTDVELQEMFVITNQAGVLAGKLKFPNKSKTYRALIARLADFFGDNPVEQAKLVRELVKKVTVNLGPMPEDIAVDIEDAILGLEVGAERAKKLKTFR